MPTELPRLMVIKLECPNCGKVIEVSKYLSDNVIDFNADRQCCGKWMEHRNKRVEVIKQDEFPAHLNRM